VRRFQSARDLAFNLEILRSPTDATAPANSGSRITARAKLRRHWLLWLGVILAMMGAASVSHLVDRAPRASTAAPKVEPITFGLGFVSGARFTTDGRIVFSAAWDGQPVEVFVRSEGGLASQALDLRDVRLLGVSAKGELAVALHATAGSSLGARIGFGTLALVPISGGTPREVAEDVYSADWTPSGELAVVRGLGIKRQLEFPLGTTVFETVGWLEGLRVSPRGDLVAVIHSALTAPDQLLLVDRNGHVRTLRTFPEEESPTSLAWLPNGEEVWFSTHNAIWAAPLSGLPRLVYQGINNLRLEDISPSGTVLVDAQDARLEIGFMGPGSQRERRLSVLGTGEIGALLSDDGQRVLLTENSPEGALTYIRATDGAPPLKLGAGIALALSPDQKWALTEPDDFRHSVSLVPVGVGVAKTLPVPGLFVQVARWLQDNKRITFLGRRKDGTETRFYVMPLGGGDPLPITPPVGPFYFEVSPDDHLAAVRGLDDVVTLYPLEGGPPVRLPELGRDVVPTGWSENGELWVRKFREVPSRLLRFDIKQRRIVEERTVGPSDSTGVTQIINVRITPDGRAVAFEYERSLGRLYLVDGLVTPRR
jgi:eukaryotic-like serine/threonine-protein kinase